MVGGTTLAATIQSDKLKEIHFKKEILEICRYITPSSV